MLEFRLSVVHHSTMTVNTQRMTLDKQCQTPNVQRLTNDARQVMLTSDTHDQSPTPDAQIVSSNSNHQSFDVP